MEKLLLKTEMTSSKGILSMGLELYLFEEDGMIIIYSPALDLSACGHSEDEARKEFEEILRLHVQYCINKNTFVKDLQAHGWNIKSLKQKKVKAPTTEDMLKKNDTLKDIIYNREYRKTNSVLSVPEFA